MTSRGFNYQADDARPYALGTLVLAVSVLLLVRWLDSARWRDGLLFAASASLLWWVHLIFWPFYLIFAVYTCLRLLRKETGAGWRQACALFALIGLAVLPAVLRAISLLHEASAHVIVPRPELPEALLILKVKALLITGVAAFLLSRLFKWKAPREVFISGSSLVLILSWWLIDPASLFVFSWTTGSSVFVARYLYLALPGVALTAGVLVASFLPLSRLKPIALAVGLGILIFMGQWKEIWPPHHPSDWRGAASALSAWAAGDPVPVICPSPFIEAQSPIWRPDYSPQGFLYSNLNVYRTAGRVYPFPFIPSPSAKEFAQRLSVGALTTAGRFAIYGGDRNVEFWRRWFAARPELRHWRNRQLGSFGDVEVAVFSQP